MDLERYPVEVTFVLVARLFLGFIFLFSALSKVVDRRAFIQGVLDYQVLPKYTAGLFGHMLPWIEMLVALALLLGIALPFAGIAIVMLLICFIVAITINLWRGRLISCNCNSTSEKKSISWGVVARDLALILLAIPVVIVAHNAISIESWLILWQTELAMVINFQSAILIVLLFAFCVVSVQLIEQTVDIIVRTTNLKALIVSEDEETHL